MFMHAIWNCEIPALRKHDVAFLVTVRPNRPIGQRLDYNQPFLPQVGLIYVRGCEIEGLLDENGRVIEEGLFYFHVVFQSDNATWSLIGTVYIPLKINSFIIHQIELLHGTH